MRNFLILILIFTSQNIFAEHKPAQVAESINPSEPSEVKKEFLKKTGLRLGMYVQVENSHPSCLQGELQLIDLADRVTLMLGPKPIAQSIGKKKYEEKERNCKMTFDTTYNESEIHETREKICKEETVAVNTTVKFDNDKLSYSTTIKTNGKITNEFDCDLRLEAP